MAGKKGARVPTETRFCKKHGEDTEHREYSRTNKEYYLDENGKKVYTGKVYKGSQWRCYPCMKDAINANHKKRGINVGARTADNKDKDAA